jgi:hypothetical protein
LPVVSLVPVSALNHNAHELRLDTQTRFCAKRRPMPLE